MTPGCASNEKQSVDETAVNRSDAPTNFKPYSLAAVMRPTLAAADNRTCMVLRDQSVYCYDANPKDGRVYGQSIRLDKHAFGPGEPEDFAKSVAVGPTLACAILGNDRVSCWGSLGKKQFDASDFIDLGKQGTEPHTAAMVSIGRANACALLMTGGIQCWGESAGRLIYVADPAAVIPGGMIRSPRAATQIASGESEMCALFADGSVRCWTMRPGYDAFASVGWDQLFPDRATMITVGQHHVCALLTNGDVYCGGQNKRAELGTLDGRDAVSFPKKVGIPRDIGGQAVVAIQASGFGGHTCALYGSGDVRCWGDNESRQSVDDATMVATPSIAVVARDDTASKATMLALGATHTCIGTATGKLVCWGGGKEYSLSGGSAPIPPPGKPVGDRLIAASSTFSIAASQPIVAPKNSDRTRGRIAAGSDFTCRITESGNVSCWGEGNAGQLGIGLSAKVFAPPRYAIPLIPLGFGRAVAISARKQFACALSEMGKIACWGVNDLRQLGFEGAGSQKVTAVTEVLISRAAIDMSVGDDHGCAILVGGDVECWGLSPTAPWRAIAGQPAYTLLASAPMPRWLPWPARTIASAGKRSCAGSDSGREFVCWGKHELDQQSDPPAFSSFRQGSFPVPASAIELGKNHGCALLLDGTFQCWGRNDFGQLGYGDKSNRPDPGAPIALPKRTIALALGDETTCAIVEDHSVVCWGKNDSGQIGTLTEREVLSPMQPSPPRRLRKPLSLFGRATAIAVGPRHACAEIDMDLTRPGDGGVESFVKKTAQCWGDATTGALGIGDPGASEAEAITVLSADLYPMPVINEHFFGDDFDTYIPDAGAQ